jgi:hypothetical protein
MFFQTGRDQICSVAETQPAPGESMIFTRPGLLLRVEGLAVLAVSLIVYQHTAASWWQFALLLLVPDVFMLGYIVNNRVGASIYNLVHTYGGPAILSASSISLHRLELVPYIAIWTAHIGMDRALGFGLKYPTAFKDTHLQRV